MAFTDKNRSFHAIDQNIEILVLFLYGRDCVKVKPSVGTVF